MLRRSITAVSLLRRSITAVTLLRRSITAVTLLRRSITAVALVALAGCQDYNFNPVGKCIIQPGSSRIQLSSNATADVLFVVDDSGSMTAEQNNLKRNFSKFIDGVAQIQADRVNAGTDPFEFHIAVTTSSIFESWQPKQAETCGGSPTLQCVVPKLFTRWNVQDDIATCTDAGAACNDLVRYYSFPESGACSNPGVGTSHAPYPSGDFVAAPGNPRVLHFKKDLNWSTWGTATPDTAITDLVKQFQGNIQVGVCGSAMEQHLEAGRLAVKKALQQEGLKQPSGVSADDWPHPGAKMVVVWVGDEDDCSNPNDPTKSLAFTPTTADPGNDVCVNDTTNKKFPVSDYAAFFTTLGRPFSAAFIYSADPSTCADDGNGNIVCTPGKCTCQCPTSCATCSGSNLPEECQITGCSGSSPGNRFHDLSAQLRAKGVATLDGSVCDANFGQTLQRIANLVKPPPGLTLPTKPASSEVAVLRIESADGTSRYCTGPGADLDWNFVDCKTGAQEPAGSTTDCININHATKHCEANPGETYIAQYLGLVPQPSASNLDGGCATTSDCTAALGGVDKDWTCAPVGSRGTCVCAQ